MTLYGDGRALCTYHVAIGRGARGPKERDGDHKTPEGDYVIDAKKKPSRFFLALHISYPNAADLERAHRLGVNPGGAIEIHGLPSWLAWLGPLHRTFNWTDGCIAVTNSEIQELWLRVPVGTPVEIKP
jgi:murein L,D-transpeptidase YafK